MIAPISLAAATEYLNGQLMGEAVNAQAEFNSVSTDTRSVAAGELFVALKGENFNAHDYLASAVESGALALVVERYQASIKAVQIVVEDTTIALGLLGKMVREMFTGTLVALTGSCGKTSVKEMLANVLSQSFKVHATKGNFNNHIGVPLTLLDLSAEHDYAVIEMGASGRGEISYLVGLAQPHVALVNNIMAAHLEGFGSEADVAYEKSRIFYGLEKLGVAVINFDEPYAPGWIQELVDCDSSVSFLTYSSRSQKAFIYSSNEQLSDSCCYQFDLNISGEVLPIKLSLAGRQNISNALAVAACAHALQIDFSDIKAGLESVTPVMGRVEPKPGLNGSIIIDDSYNANPGSVRAAADLLCDMQAHGKEGVLVLGDLAELGDGQEKELTELGCDIADKGVTHLVTVGKNSSFIARGFSAAAKDEMLSVHKADHAAAIEYIRKQLKNNMAVLVKGSRSSKMEVVVNAITQTRGDE